MRAVSYSSGAALQAMIAAHEDRSDLAENLHLPSQVSHHAHADGGIGIYNLGRDNPAT